MKRVIIALLLLVPFIVNGQTNVYHPLPDSNAVWNFHYFAYNFYEGPCEESYSITISGDTLIDSKTYHKLVTPYVQFISGKSCGGAFAGYRGAIRQDTTERKVYYVPPSETTERLLYDFTMQVGDTVKGYIEDLTFDSPDVVISIDSVLVGDSYRKRWYINEGYFIYIIEGIGSTFGLFERSPGFVVDIPGYLQLCFQQNGEALYPNSENNCQLITSVNDVNEYSEQLDVYPNPSNGSFMVDFENMDVTDIILYDMYGNVVLQQQVNNQTTTTICNLESGAYILTAISKNGSRITKKIVCNR